MGKRRVNLIILASVLVLAACSTTDSIPTNEELDQVSTNSEYAANGVTTHPVQELSYTSLSKEEEDRYPCVGNHAYYFDFNQSKIQEPDIVSLRVQARYLFNHPEAKVLIVGNTDERGSREYNIALGYRRAKSIQRFLLEHFVNQNQILTVSYGAEKPVAFGHCEQDYAKNRRADLEYQVPIITDKH